ncbi:MAG: CIA30 family protein [Planctomycetota bacterium]
MMPAAALSAALTAALAAMANPEPVSPLVLANFEPGNADDPRWLVVNDNVMGGRSTGGPAMHDGSVTFSGFTNTNGGGFSSIRTERLDLDLSEHEGITIRVRGDRRAYRIMLRTDARFRRDTFSYAAEFTPSSESEWSEVFLPFPDFRASWRGSDIQDQVPSLDPAKIEQIGVIIGDGIHGEFSLEIDEIRATAAPLPDPEPNPKPGSDGKL